MSITGDNSSADLANVEQSAIPQDFDSLIPSSKMIDDLVSPAVLLPEYRENPLPGFLPGISYLTEKYVKGMRRVRGDGNCFYRAFLFSYLEHLFDLHKVDSTAAEIEQKRFLDTISECNIRLTAIGYEEFTFECFFDALVALVSKLFAISRDDLLASFQEDGESDYYTWYMRLLTSLKLQEEADRFFPFVTDFINESMDVYCKREVEPMGKECEQLQIIAISDVLGVHVSIEYLDGRELQMQDSTLALPTIECLGDSNNNNNNNNVIKITLLYRPGHYDILY